VESKCQTIPRIDVDSEKAKVSNGSLTGTFRNVHQRGFTLIEVLIVAAIVITVAAMAFGMSNGARPIAMRSSATQFDAALAYGKALAATSGNGATLVIEPRESAGFAIDVYSGRPTVADALHPSGMATVAADGNIAESTLGAPPFAVFIDGAGHVSMAQAPLNATPAPMASEPACPASGQWMLTITDARTHAGDTRALPCTKAIGGSPD
jgi:prepilin-type N-terminal cleavage/methylation domain-containing protein